MCKWLNNDLQSFLMKKKKKPKLDPKLDEAQSCYQRKANVSQDAEIPASDFQLGRTSACGSLTQRAGIILWLKISNVKAVVGCPFPLNCAVDGV